MEDFLEGSFEQRANQLVRMAKNDPDYLNPSLIDNYFKPIRKLLDMKDVTLSWKRIHTTFPEIDNIAQTREWKREEIQDMLKFANGAIDRVIVLIAASSGIRSGAFKLHWEDVIPIYKANDQLKIVITDSERQDIIIACAMIIVYK